MATRRDTAYPTFGGEIAAVARALGVPFMPWQKHAADIFGEYDPVTLLPRYRDALITVPRQSGKTTLFLSFLIHRCIHPRWKEVQRTAYTSYTGSSAREKWTDELVPLINNSVISKFIERIYMSAGHEKIGFRNKGSIRLIPTTESMGHSKTLHLVVNDEIWYDIDERRENGLSPTMVTVENAQMLGCSTAGTDQSLYFNRKLKDGRKAVEQDLSTMAFIEYAAPAERAEDWDHMDEASYYTFMPALCPDPPCRCGGGKWRHTTTMRIIRSERERMDAASFKRAYGNLPTIGAHTVIPIANWASVCDQYSAPHPLTRFAADMSAQRDEVTIVACSHDNSTVECVENIIGDMGRVVDRCNELVRNHGVPIVIDGNGPMASMASKLENCIMMKPKDVAMASGLMYDAIINGTIRFRATPYKGNVFNDSVIGAQKKKYGEMWMWDREKSYKPTALIAATLGMHRFGPGDLYFGRAA